MNFTRVFLIVIAALAISAPAANAQTREYEGTVVSVDRAGRTFRIHDSERGTIRVRVTSRTRFERVTFSTLRAGAAQHRDDRPPLQRPLGRARGRALGRRRQPRRRRLIGRRRTATRRARRTPSAPPGGGDPPPGHGRPPSLDAAVRRLSHADQVGSANTRRSWVAAAPRIAASAPKLEGMTGGTAPLPPSTRVASSEAMTGASHSVIGAKWPPSTIACGLSRFTTVPSATPSQRAQSSSAASAVGSPSLGAADQLCDRLARAARVDRVAVQARGGEQRLQPRHASRGSRASRTRTAARRARRSCGRTRRRTRGSRGRARRRARSRRRRRSRPTRRRSR